MTTRRKSEAMRFLEARTGGRLTLAELLEAIRLGEALSQVEFAKRLHISKSHLCDIEKGRKTVSPARAAKFAQVLGYSSQQFVRLSLQDQIRQAGLRFRVEVQTA